MSTLGLDTPDEDETSEHQFHVVFWKFQTFRSSILELQLKKILLIKEKVRNGVKGSLKFWLEAEEARSVIVNWGHMSTIMIATHRISLPCKVAEIYLKIAFQKLGFWCACVFFLTFDKPSLSNRIPLKFFNQINALLWQNFDKAKVILSLYHFFVWSASFRANKQDCFTYFFGVRFLSSFSRMLSY